MSDDPLQDQMQAENELAGSTQFTVGRRQMGTSRYGYQDPSTLAQGLAITQLVPDIADGDVGRDAIRIAAAMHAMGARSEILGDPGPNTGTNVLARLPGMGVHFEPIPLQRTGLGALASNRKRVERHARLFQPSLLHAHSRAPAWVALKVAQRLQVPLVTTVHGLFNYRSRFKRSYNAIMARGTRVIVPSKYLAEHVAEHYPEAGDRVRLVPRGINLVAYNRNRFHLGDVQAVRDVNGLVAGRPVLVCAGRLSFWKGQHLFIDLIHRLRDLGVYGLIYSRVPGKKEYRQSLDAMIKKRKLQESVKIITAPVDMRPVYLAADAVVSAAVEPEAFIHAVAEAMVLGQPVIAPSHGAGPEQITHHETGWLYPPNDIGALEQATREALALTDEQRLNLGQWAMDDAVQAYDQDRTMRDTLDVYREAIWK